VFTIILLLYVQLHLEVTLESSSLRGPLPTPRAYAAAWHDAVCLPINRDVKVNELAPLDLRQWFERPPPPGECGAAGAWRRLAELCVPAARP
jgi:hypothetical protein